MSDVDRHDELEAMVAPWVLGALDPAEEQTVRAHVEACPTCRELAARLRRVVGALPLAADEVAPPARLRARVLAAAGAAEQPVGAPRPVAVTRQARALPPFRAGLARRMPAYALAAVALVALLAGVLVGQVALRGPGPAAPAQVARFTLTGHGQMAGAQATVVDLRTEDVALVDFAGLPQLAAGRVYELWLVPAKGAPVAAAVFVPDADGRKVVLVNGSLAGYAVMAVTDEAGPDGASAPTQQPQLYGNVARS